MTTKRVAERARIDVIHFCVLREGCIDIKDHGHVHFLMGIKTLLIEAEALDLFEVDAAPQWRDVERGMPDRFLVTEILGAENRTFRFR